MWNAGKRAGKERSWELLVAWLLTLPVGVGIGLVGIWVENPHLSGVQATHAAITTVVFYSSTGGVIGLLAYAIARARRKPEVEGWKPTSEPK